MIYYHGTSSACGITYKLMPPVESKFLQEEGRKKNLDKVFFTADLKSAQIYAGRACNRFGGNPVIFRVIPMSKIVCLNSTLGSSVYYCSWAFVEKI
jgi:hypothetical protein